MVVKAMAEQEDNQDAQDADKKSKPTMKIIIVAIVLSIVLSGGIVGVTMFLLAGGDENQVTQANDEDVEDVEELAEDEPSESLEPPMYHSMDPQFVVSFRDQKKARFMQFSFEIMTRDKDVIEQLELHNPAVRSSLLLLIDSQDSAQMITREGKEQLLLEMTDDINNTLEEMGAEPGVEAAYYKTFVIQ